MDQPQLNIHTLASGPGWKVQSVTCSTRGSKQLVEEVHDSHVIAWVAQGSFTYHGETGRHLLHNGSLLLGHRDQCYACGHQHDGGDTCVALKIEDELFAELACSATGRSRFRFPEAKIAVPADAEARFRQLARTGGNVSREGLVHETVSLVLAHLSGTPSRATVRLSDELRIEDSIRFAEQALADAPSLDQLAETAGLSKFHYLRLFKMVTGTTPHRYLLDLRLGAAANRLLESRVPVTAIAFDSGFGDLSSFVRQFKVRYGKSPTAFRRWGS
jgi:AraC family transcriptional regulator